MEIIGGNIYTNNEVTDGLVEAVKDRVKSRGLTRVFFGVSGRTLHSTLSARLSEKLPELEVEITDNYGCKISKKGWMESVDGSYTVSELREIASELCIEGFSNMSKYYLMVLVNDAITSRNSKL